MVKLKFGEELGVDTSRSSLLHLMISRADASRPSLVSRHTMINSCPFEFVLLISGIWTGGAGTRNTENGENHTTMRDIR